MLSEKQRRKIYARISRRYKTLAKKLGENWKELKINDLLFKEAYEIELRSEMENPSNLRPSRTIDGFVKSFMKGKQIETVHGGYGALTENELSGVDVFGENQSNPEPIPIPDTRSKEEKKFHFRVKNNPEIQQTKAYLRWREEKHKEEKENGNEN